jgi:hypothetical protein
MTDEELTAFLRDLPFLRAAEAADRIEALTVERDELAAAKWNKQHADTMNDIVLMGLARDATTARAEELEAKLAECLERNALLEARLGKAVELLKEARQDLEEYVTHEWPKDEHPVYERKWERDMELCRRIDATLAEIENSEAVTLGEKG